MKPSKFQTFLFLFLLLLMTFCLNDSSQGMDQTAEDKSEGTSASFQVLFQSRPTGEDIPPDTVRIEYRLCFPKHSSPQGSVRVFDDTESKAQFWTTLQMHDNCTGMTKNLVFKSSAASPEQIIRFEFDDSIFNQTQRFKVNLAELDFRLSIQSQNISQTSTNPSQNWGRIPITALPKSMMNFFILQKQNALSKIQNVYFWLPAMTTQSSENSNKARLVLNSEIYMLPISRSTLSACGSFIYNGKIRDAQIPGLGRLQNLTVTLLDNRKSHCRTLHKENFELEIQTLEDSAEPQVTGLLNAIMP